MVINPDEIVSASWTDAEQTMVKVMTDSGDLGMLTHFVPADEGNADYQMLIERSIAIDPYVPEEPPGPAA